MNYYNNERIQEKTKWMPPTKFRGGIHVHLIQFFMCPEFWVH
ncbi:MAG: hypothetical protein ACLT09_18960, partial [Flavonifractor plautii]